jgi:hypothetical protein
MLGIAQLEETSRSEALTKTQKTKASLGKRKEDSSGQIKVN